MLKNWILSLTAIFTGLISTQFSGCASGGYKWTRAYSQWVNSTHIVLRIVLYILTSVVYVVTLIVDAVIFNTMDFWNGTVSKGTYEFKEGDKTYVVTHDIQNGLRSSLIKIHQANKQINTFEIRETAQNEIELYKDGQLQAKGTDLNSLPQIVVFKNDGKSIDSKTYLFTQFSSKFAIR